MLSIEPSSEPGFPGPCPKPGDVLHAFGDAVTVHLTGEQTQSAFALCSLLTPPGGGPPLHYHLQEDEVFIVQEGRVQFEKDGVRSELGAGAVVYAPRLSVHAYRNIGDGPLRMWVMTQPAGFETFFARCAAEWLQPRGPNMDRIVEIATEHGIHFVPTGPVPGGTTAVP